MKHRKILYLYSKMTPDNQSGYTLFAGGAQKRVFQMAVFFKEQGYNVYLGSDDNTYSLIVAQLRKNGVQHMSLPFRQSVPRKILALTKLIKIVRKNKIDIIHCNDRFTSLFGKIVSIFLRVTMVYTARNIFNDKKYTRWFLGNRIIAVSDGVKSDLISNFNLNPKNISVIYNGTDIKHASNEAKKSVLETFGLRNTDRIISSIGRLSTQKGLIYLIKAISDVVNSFPSVKLLLVGDGELKNELVKLVAELKLEKHVNFCGNQQEVEVFYEISEFTVMPSLWEGLSGSAIESIMLGRPVIATRIGGFPEIFENNVNGLLVPPRDSLALAGAIKYLLSNPQLVKEMGRAGKIIAKEKFTLEKMLQEYSNYYARIS